MGQLANQRVDLFEGERCLRLPFEIAPYEAIVRRLDFQRGGTGIVEPSGAVLLGEGDQAEDSTYAGLALATMDVRGQSADVFANVVGTLEELKRRGRRAGWPILLGDPMSSGALPKEFAEQLSGDRVENSYVDRVPLDVDLLAEPPGRNSVVGASDFDAAVDVYGALSEFVEAEWLEGQRQQRRLLLREHRRYLPPGRAVDAGVRPACLPVIEIVLRELDTLEALTLERGALRVTDARFDLALPIRMPDPTCSATAP